MKRRQFFFASICLLAVGMSLLFTGCSMRDTTLYSYRRAYLEEDDWEDILRENQISPCDNITVNDLSADKNVSFHLVQIRDREVPHIHKKHDLTVIVKKGKGRMYLGRSVFRVEPDAIIFIPRGVPYCFVNGTDEVAAIIAIFTPGFDGKDVVPVEMELKPPPEEELALPLLTPGTTSGDASPEESESPPGEEPESPPEDEPLSSTTEEEGSGE